MTVSHLLVLDKGIEKIVFYVDFKQEIVSSTTLHTISTPSNSGITSMGIRMK